MSYELEELLQEKRVVVDGGHFTLRPKKMKFSSRLPAGVFYFEAASDDEEFPAEVFRTELHGEVNRCWIVVCINPSKEVSVEDLGTPDVIWTLNSPTTTEFETFNKAANKYVELRMIGVTVQLFVLIGDLKLPQELRRETQWMLPFQYAIRIDDDAINCRVVGESRCRNIAFRKIVKIARENVQDETFLNKLYGWSGATFILGRDPTQLDTFLAAECLLNSNVTRFPLIAISKSPNMPSCAATIAGKIKLISDDGCDFVMSWHDIHDDDLIREKHVEGVILSSLMFKDLSLEFMLLTSLQGELSREEKFTSIEFREPGRNNEYTELRANSERAARKYNIEIIRSET